MKRRTRTDPGLVAAINAVGLPRIGEQLGITLQAVASWRRVPAERVIAVERITGVNRTILRPDLYPDDDAQAMSISPVRSIVTAQVAETPSV